MTKGNNECETTKIPIPLSITVWVFIDIVPYLPLIIK